MAEIGTTRLWFLLCFTVTPHTTNYIHAFNETMVAMVAGDDVPPNTMHGLGFFPVHCLVPSCAPVLGSP